MLPQLERVVVTGGAGFIGSHLVERLLREGAGTVLVLDNFSRGGFTNLEEHLGDSRLRVVQGDVRDLGSVRDVMAGATLTFHLAASSSRIAETEEAFTTNVGGTFAVLRAASDLALGRLVFASSCQTYGAPLTLPVDEDHPLLAVDLEGASKVSGEAYCRAFRRVFGLQTAVLRFTEVYGPRDSAGRVARWIQKAIDGDAIVVSREGPVSDLLWVGHAVEALMRAGTCGVTLPPINVASGTGTPPLELARRITRLVGGHVDIRSRSKSETHDERFVADVERMRRLLQVEPPLDPLEQLPAVTEALAPRRRAKVAS